MFEVEIGAIEPGAKCGPVIPIVFEHGSDFAALTSFLSGNDDSSVNRSYVRVFSVLRVRTSLVVSLNGRTDSG